MKLIIAIVERGKANGVVKAAAAAGAGGATIYAGRGAGEHTFSLFGNMQIDPGKEIINILARDDGVDALFDVVAKAAQTHLPGRGVAFVVPVERVAGLSADKTGNRN